MQPLIYDLEIEKAIVDRYEPPIDGIQYCAGWSDFSNMGIACICAYDYVEERYRVFTRGNLRDFLLLTHERSPLVGFNNINFDNRVLAATLGAGGFGQLGEDFFREEKFYDLLREIWAANGLGPVFCSRTHGGYGLDASCKANGLGGKTGDGALATVWWQQGQYGLVIDYCLNDVRLSKLLFDLAIENKVKDPKTGRILNLRAPA